MRKRKGPIEDLTGMVFGHLKVLRMDQDLYRNKKGSYFGICECSCGRKDIWILASSLKRGSTKSCGCSKERYEKTRGSKSKQFTGYKTLSGCQWGRIKRKAEIRGLDFKITIQEAYSVFEKQSHLCALTGIKLAMSSKKLENTASLDRIDSSQGYLIENIQWVHKEINIMRNVFTVERFVEMCRLVTERHKNENHPEKSI